MDHLRMAKRHSTMTSILLLCVVGVVRLTMGDSNVEFTLEEERNVGTVVGSLGDDRVLPLGLDATVRGSLGYNLLPVIARSNLFTVDERTGQIFTKAIIDRETLCSTDKQCDLDIQVVVQSTVSQFFKKVKVTIKVQDINDNSPTFPRATTTLNILESASVGTNFALESASDLDIGVNGVRDYELAPNDGAFYVNLTRLDNDVTLVSLVLRHELDRETKPLHRMVLTARDGGQPTRPGSMTIVVNVEDVNDNAPTFDKSLYNVSLPEVATLGTPVVTVSATDNDSDQYGIKEYRFAPLDREDVTKYFAINATTGQITVAGSLLEKQGETFRILVECLDKGVPPLVSRAEVDVTVEDTVNSAPIISVNVMFGGSVSELAQSGTVVALIGVLDRDAGLNGLVSCSIVSDAFELQPLSVNEYKVIVVRKLDREAEPVHNVTVFCEDAGSPRMSSTVNFEVKPLSIPPPLAIRHTRPLAIRRTHPLTIRHTHPLAIRHTRPLAIRRTHPLTIRHTRPLAIRHTHPLTIRHTRPLAIRRTHPLAIRRTHPLAIRHTHPLAIRRTHPLTIRHTRPLAIRHTRPLAIRRTHPLAIRRTHPLTIRHTPPLAIRRNPSTDYQTYPSTGYQTYPSTDYQTYPSTGYQTYPSTDYQTYPSTGYQTYPSTDYKTYPSTGYQTYPSTRYQTYPSTDYQTYPSTGYQTYPSTDYQTYPSTGYQTYPSTGYQTYPSTGYQTYPSTGYQTYPSTGYQTYPSTDYQTYPSTGYQT
ncbi:Protocadherin-17 [Bulinus truncatus]|nr:Protocadherin-17 [Bulinus truncatus]